MLLSHCFSSRKPWPSSRHEAASKACVHQVAAQHGWCPEHLGMEMWSKSPGPWRCSPIGSGAEGAAGPTREPLAQLDMLLSSAHGHPRLPLLQALKILQARLQQYVNREFPDVQAGFRKGRLPTSPGSSKKQQSSRNTSISALLTMPKPLTVWITINCGKF